MTHKVLAPRGLFYGNRWDGSVSNWQTAAVVNIDPSPLTIQSVSCVGDYELGQLPSFPLVLSQGQELLIPCRYSPKNLGFSTGSITVKSSSLVKDIAIELYGNWPTSDVGNRIYSRGKKILYLPSLEDENAVNLFDYREETYKSTDELIFAPGVHEILLHASYGQSAKFPLAFFQRDRRGRVTPLDEGQITANISFTLGEESVGTVEHVGTGIELLPHVSTPVGDNTDNYTVRLDSGTIDVSVVLVPETSEFNKEFLFKFSTRIRDLLTTLPYDEEGNQKTSYEYLQDDKTSGLFPFMVEEALRLNTLPVATPFNISLVDRMQLGVSIVSANFVETIYGEMNAGQDSLTAVAPVILSADLYEILYTTMQGGTESLMPTPKIISASAENLLISHDADPENLDISIRLIGASYESV